MTVLQGHFLRDSHFMVSRDIPITVLEEHNMPFLYLLPSMVCGSYIASVVGAFNLETTNALTS